MVGTRKMSRSGGVIVKGHKRHLYEIKLPVNLQPAIAMWVDGLLLRFFINGYGYCMYDVHTIIMGSFNVAK